MFRIIITVILTTFISACSMQVYKLNVQQGNIVTQDMLEKLEPGMSKRQVAYVMGSPVLQDTFTEDRWDYIYRSERREDQVKQYHIAIHFDKSGNYSHYEGELGEEVEVEALTPEEKPVKAFGEPEKPITP